LKKEKQIAERKGVEHCPKLAMAVLHKRGERTSKRGRWKKRTRTCETADVSPGEGDSRLGQERE